MFLKLRFVSGVRKYMDQPRALFVFAAACVATAIFSLPLQTASAQLVYSTSTRASDGDTVIDFSSGSGDWTIPTGVTSVQVLVVGGGGGGAGVGTNNGGGGGGGGFYYDATYAVTPGASVDVTVGSGGAAGGNGSGGNGGTSIFDILQAYGGAGGNATSGSPGGSSGGNNQGGSGYAGGPTEGGGGGAGQAGQGPWYSSNNRAGAGLSSSITGISTYYGGGGACCYNGAQGGLGGGGSTDDVASPTPGMQNGVNGLGGGGAGGRGSASDVGSGGSGVVIVAYGLPALTWTWTAGGNPTFVWSDSSNWSSSQAPVNGKPLIFSGTLGLSNTNDIAGLNVGGITFDSTAGGFNLSGNSIQLSGGIYNNSTTAQTVGLSMTLVGTSQSLNAASGNIVVNGAIGDGGSGLGVNLNGSAAVTLAGNNTYAGQTALISGTLVVGNTGSLGTGTLTIGGGTLDSSVANLVNANNNPEIWNTSSIYFQGTNNLDLGSGSVTVTSSPKVTVNSGTLGVGGISGSGYTLTKMGSGTLLLHGMTTLGNLFLGYNLNGGNSPTSSQGTVVIGSGGTLSIGNGSSNNLYIGWGSGNGYGGIGTLDASAAAVVNINVARVEVGATCGSYGTLILGASNTITASTDFGVNNGQWGYNNAFGTLSTAANSTTTIQTPILYVGYNIPNGTTGGSGQFLLGSGGTMNIAGIGGGRTALTIGSQGGYNGQDTFLSTMDLSAGNGIASLTLSSLIVGQDLGGNGYGQGQLILSSNAANHLDISGTGSVVLIGDNGGSSSSTGGTLTIGNLNASSAITSTDNSTAILLANARSTGSPTGVLNLGGGSLTITTAGSAIAGGGGTSVLNLGSATSGVTLIAGASSPNWIQNLTTAQINAGGVTFNPGGNSITIPQALSGSGGLTVAGAGILNLSGSNSYLGGTHVSGGTLQVGNYNALGSGGLTANAGVVDLAGISPAALSSFSGSSGLITNSGPSSTTLYVGQSSATTFSGTFQDGASSVGLTLNSGTLTLLGSNTQSGATTVNLGASLIAGAANTLSPNSAVTINGGLLDVTAGSQSIAGLTIYSGALNLHVGNLLTSTAYSSLGGVLNVYETTPGTAELISFPNSYSGTFTPGSLPSGYALSYGNANQVDLVLASANSSAWTSSLGGSWTGSSNWTSGVPSGQAFTALLGGALAASGTVTLDGPQTLGTLIFSNSAASYALTAGNSGSLTLDNTGGSGGSQIIVLAGTHSITAPLTIANGPALISLINSGSLDISGDVSEAGGSHSLSLSSSDATGVLSLDGSNSFTGGVYVNSGTLILNGASALAPGSTLVIGTTSPPSLPTVISSPVAVPTANLAPVPEPGTRSLFMVCAAALGFSYLLRNSLKTTDF